MGCVVCRPCLPPSIPSVVQTRVTCRCSDWERCGTVWLVPRPHSSSPPHSELTQPSNHLECPSWKEGVPEGGHSSRRQCLLEPQFLYLCSRNLSQRVNQSDSEKDGWAELHATSQLDGPAVLG